jgi:hypothetical protein
VNLGRRPILPEHTGGETVKYCNEIDAKYYGLQIEDVMRMAFQIAIRNGIQNQFSLQRKSTGKKWLHGFLKRNPELTVRTAQGIYRAEVKGFNTPPPKKKKKTFKEILPTL